MAATPANTDSHNVFVSLVRHVYAQTNIALGASLFCALIVVAGLYSAQDNVRILVWFGFYFVVTALRFGSVMMFQRDKLADRNIYKWRNIYIIGAVLGGVSWGIGAIILLPYISATQQTLLILMLAGVTAGAVPLSAAIPLASICFLVFSLVPYIASLALFNSRIYALFDLALSLYLAYTIILTKNTYQLIKQSLELQFENRNLLKTISDAKNELEATNKKLEVAATHDYLTHIANRRLFHEKFENALSRAQQKESMLALFYIDLDQFKLVNDIYGHAVGDRLLLMIVERLEIFTNKGNNLARLGGDEFTIILENLNGQIEVEAFAKQLCQLISMPYTINDVLIKITASIGIAIFPDDGIRSEALMHHADKAMYDVKDHGGNNYQLSKMPSERV